MLQRSFSRNLNSAIPFGVGLRPLLVAAAVGVVACAGTTSPGAAEPYNPSNLAAGQLSRVGQICESVVGVHRGEEHYDSCVESLSDSLSNAAQARGLQRARSDCMAKGYAPNSPGLAECTLEAGSERASWGRADDAGGGAEPAVAKSYFYASPSEAYRRDQLACARLGLDPAGGAFASCAASLRASLFAADNPMN